MVIIFGIIGTKFSKLTGVVEMETKLLHQKKIELWGHKYLVRELEINIRSRGRTERTFIKRINGKRG